MWVAVHRSIPCFASGLGLGLGRLESVRVSSGLRVWHSYLMVLVRIRVEVPCFADSAPKSTIPVERFMPDTVGSMWVICHGETRGPLQAQDQVE